jgi:hypothetical protein
MIWTVNKSHSKRKPADNMPEKDIPHPIARVQIKLRGQLDQRWAEWVDPLVISYSASEEITLLSGSLPDQSALLGILNKLVQVNLTLISVDTGNG